MELQWIGETERHVWPWILSFSFQLETPVPLLSK